jgi:hypothetical protein
MPLVQGITQTPQPFLQITDASDNVIAEIFPARRGAGRVDDVRYTWGVDLPLSAQIGATRTCARTRRCPRGFILPAGFKIKTVTQGIGANTDYGVPSYFVIEYS